MRSILRSLAFASLLATPAMLAWGSVGCIISDDQPSESTGGSCGPGDVGSEGCPCTSGGMCNAPFMCNDNLDICVADVCPVGTETCACTPKGVCDPGLVCLSDHCVEEGCSPGTEACNCTPGGSCDPGLSCLSGLCVDATGATTGGTATTTSGGADDTTGGGATSTGAVDETGATGG